MQKNKKKNWLGLEREKTQSDSQLLDHFYAIFALGCLTFLLIGVPFVFVRKGASAVMCSVSLLATLSAWYAARKGYPKPSLVLFSAYIWLVAVVLMFGGLPPVTASIILVLASMLAVVVRLRVGATFGVSFVLVWLLYLVLRFNQMAPPVYFTGATLTGWFIGGVSLWLVLLPIPKLISDLRKGSSLLQAVIESTTDGLLVVDTHGKVVNFNQRFLQLWNIPDSLATTENDSVLLDYVTQQLIDPVGFVQEVQKLYGDPEKDSFDKLELREGRVFERYSSPHRLGPRVIGRVWSFRDITTKVNAEREILLEEKHARELAQMLRSILDNVPVGISVFDANLRLLTYNQQFQSLMQLPDTLLKEPQVSCEAIVHYVERNTGPDESSRKLVIENILRIARSSQPHVFERVREDGATIEIHGVPMPDGGMVTVYTDLTSRKLVEAQARQSEALLRASIEAIDEAFVVFGPDDRLVMCNDKYRAIYPKISDLIAPGVSFEEIARGAAERGQFLDAQGRVDEWLEQRMNMHCAGSGSAQEQRLDDGRVLRVAERKLPDGHLVGFRIDVTDLVSATDAAEKANLSKSRFLAAMSHEIRTPMNGILGMAQLLMQPDLDAADRTDYARTILTSGNTLMRLLNDILDLSKIEAGKLPIETRTFRPAQLLKDACQLFAGAARQKKLELASKWSGSPSREYMADANHITQMLNNLIGNAVKFTHQGGIEVTGREIDSEGNTVLLEFSVRDTGIGIANDKLTELFKPFSQVDSSRTRSSGGTGLGLAIVRELATLMGGEAGVESAPGRGARFWFRIRATFNDRDKVLPHQVDSKPMVAGALRGKVLVVEDDLINRMVVCTQLNMFGITLVQAVNGSQAVAIFKEQSQGIELILMDLHMPEMDGLEATRQIRSWELQESRPQVPIIALTADAFLETREQCTAAGMNDFLAKPMTVSELHLVLKRWLPSANDLSGTAPTRETDLPEPDWQRLDAALKGLIPLLQAHKFDALTRFREIKEIASHTTIEQKVAEIDQQVQAFDFGAAAISLSALVDLNNEAQ